MKERLIQAGSLVALGLLTQAAFSKASRMKILRRDNFTCVETGKRWDDGFYVMASHLDHDKTNPDYDEPHMGVTHSVEAHLNYHLDHVGQAEEIGLTEHQNNFAITALQNTNHIRWGWEEKQREKAIEELSQLSLDELNESLFG